MKKVLLLALALCLAVAVGIALADVNNSDHDMRTKIADETSNQVCIYCHHPHGTTSSELLWNRSNSTATYTLYSNADTLDATMEQPSMPESTACLSCHDGTIALNAVTVQPAGGSLGTATYIPAGPAALGTDLSNDHPVAFAIDSGDAGIEAAAAIEALGLPLYGATNDRVECATCHSVHDAVGSGSADNNISFMRRTTDNSQICIDCHINK